MSRPAASQRSIRRQKLSIKLPLRIIQERELEEAENNDLPAANKIETGVEKHEESVSNICTNYHISDHFTCHRCDRRPGPSGLFAPDDSLR